MSREIHMSDLAKAPSIITGVSFGTVLAGARHLDTPGGKFAVLAGRAGDLVDGYVARKFDMSSDAGAIADVTADKLGMLAIGHSAWKRDIVPKPVLAAMGAKHLTNAVATTYNGLRDKQRRSIRPPKSGKLSMFADNISIGAFLIADELQPGTAEYRSARAVGYAAFAAGLAFGIDAAHHYISGEFDEDTSHSE